MCEFYFDESPIPGNCAYFTLHSIAVSSSFPSIGKHVSYIRIDQFEYVFDILIPTIRKTSAAAVSRPTYRSLSNEQPWPEEIKNCENFRRERERESGEAKDQTDTRLQKSTPAVIKMWNIFCFKFRLFASELTLGELALALAAVSRIKNDISIFRETILNGKGWDQPSPLFEVFSACNFFFAESLNFHDS